MGGSSSGGPQELTDVGRVPYFVLVRKLEEAAAALRLERDNALEEVERTKADVQTFEEQLNVAKTTLQQKASTIDKLLRDASENEAELASARETTREAEHKYEVLQSECAQLTRDFLTKTQRLEEEIDRLRAIDAHRQLEVTTGGPPPPPAAGAGAPAQASSS